MVMVGVFGFFPCARVLVAHYANRCGGLGGDLQTGSGWTS